MDVQTRLVNYYWRNMGEWIPLFSMQKVIERSGVRKVGFHLAILLGIILLLTLLSYLDQLGWDLPTQNPTSSTPVSFLFLLAQTATGVILFLSPPVYLTVYWLIPSLLLQKRYLFLALGILGIVLAWGSFVSYFEPWTDEHWFGMAAIPKQFPEGIAVVSVILLLTFLINLSYRWFVQIANIRKMENDQLNKELSLLRNQINPHFFFNTLNNLYALSLEQSEETPNVILKLSEMMRYAIYECKEPLVPITSEVKYLESYIALQQIRQHDGTIEFNHSIANSSAMIAPMVLIVFVENAYKHGLESMSEGSFVKINLEVDEGEIRFGILNNFRASEPAQPGGVGLENVKRRLDLIYKDKFQLDIEQGEDFYEVSLNIQR